MYKKTLEKLQACGMEATAATITAGEYYDGRERGERFPALRVKIDFSGIDAGDVRNLEKIARRAGLSWKWCSVYGGRVYTLATAETFRECERLEARRAAFLDGFWGYRHKYGAGFDQMEAIKAGQAALAKLEAMEA